MAAPKGNRRKMTIRVAVTMIFACAVAAVVIWQVSAGRANRQLFENLLRDDHRAVSLDESLEASIEAFCGDCHAMPRAESFPRYAWHDKVLRGYEFYAQSGRSDLQPPLIHETVTYFRARAPEQLVFPEPADAETELRAQFVVEKLTVQQHADAPHGIAHLRWTRLRSDDVPVLLS